jgi:hypothetical protein
MEDRFHMNILTDLNVFTKSHTDASESDNSCSDSLVYLCVQKIPMLRNHSFTLIPLTNRTIVSCPAGYLILLKEEFEDTKGVIIIGKSKTNRQHIVPIWRYYFKANLSKYTVYLCVYRFTTIIFYEVLYSIWSVEPIICLMENNADQTCGNEEKRISEPNANLK